MREPRSAPPRAKIAVIGAGIVGNCLVEHLARLGWDDLVLLDKGALPNPGGSTGHASNFIFPTDHGREIALLTLESQRQYEALGVNTTCGGIEIARTEARMEELRRRMTSARVWGIESELLAPAEVAARVPFVNPDVILGGFYTPSVSVVDSVRAGTIMRQRALARGVLTVLDETEVTGLEVEPVPFGRPRIRAVATTRGTIEVDHAIIACGVWSPRIAAMAGASISLTPAVHQMADFGPVEILLGTGDEIGYPIVRDMDSFMYERQSAGAMEVGSYAHRPILMHPDDIPSVAEAERSPTELPFTAGDFAPQLEQAREIMGELLAGTEMQYAVNGLLSLTPDTQQVLGETTEVANLWSAAAVWVKEGPGSARLVAEWITHGYPRLCDPHGSDVARFQPHERTGHHIRLRCREHFTKTYGIVHPREQWESARGMNRSPFHPRTEALGAAFFEARGWERPQWYASNEDLVARYNVPDRPHEWDRRWWSPIINAEHLHLREKVGVVDLGAFQVFDVSGPGVVPYLERLTVNECDRPVGSSIYTPLLTPDGGFRADLTLQRLGPDRFRIVTGVFDGARDAFWFRMHLPADGSVQFQDRSSGICTLGVWGPDACALLSQVTGSRLTQDEFPYGTAREVLIDGIPATMLRISYVGESGWEIYTRTEHGLALWDAIWGAGRDFDARPVGIGVYGTTGRMEKGYLLMGSELTSEYSPVEAGLARRGVKRADFIGKAAYLRARERGPVARLCTLTMDDHTSASGLARFPTGGNEPILTLDGDRIVDVLGRESRVTSAGMGPSVGKYLLMAYLPVERARVGERLQVMYMNECFPVTVAAVGGALFDPAGIRMKICFESDSIQILSLSRMKKELEFPLTKGPINFSVLRSDGSSSNRWGVQINKKGDAYVYCRDVPEAEKVSLHTSGTQHISIPSETAARIGKDSRFANVWKEPGFGSKAIATFSLIFPPWGVGLRPERTALTKDELLIVGHEEKLVVVGFFVVDSAKKMRGRLPHFVLGRLPLRPGKTLHIIAWKEPQNDLMERIRSIFPQVSLTFSQLALGDDDYTLCVQGYRGPNSAYMVTVPVRYTPSSPTA